MICIKKHWKKASALLIKVCSQFHFKTIDPAKSFLKKKQEQQNLKVDTFQAAKHLKKICIFYRLELFYVKITLNLAMALNLELWRWKHGNKCKTNAKLNSNAKYTLFT